MSALPAATHLSSQRHVLPCSKTAEGASVMDDGQACRLSYFLVTFVMMVNTIAHEGLCARRQQQV
eukprot:767660-Hanusia_phi.AAC.2